MVPFNTGGGITRVSVKRGISVSFIHAESEGPRGDTV